MVALGGAHSCWGPRAVDSGGSDAAPGPLTQASALKAPGRLGREDASNFRVQATYMSSRTSTRCPVIAAAAAIGGLIR